MIRDIVKATLTAILVVGLAEGAATGALSLAATHSYETARNPHVRYLWLQYTAPKPRAPQERLIIIISNSQGYISGEPGEVYPARLQALLNERDPRAAYLVANWSLPDAHAPEMAVLAARAAAHHPAAVVVVAVSQDFKARYEYRPLAASKSDLHHLAYVPEVRRYLSGWFLQGYDMYSLRARLATYSRLVQAHEIIVSWMRGRTDQPVGGLTIAEPWTPSGTRLLKNIYQTFRRGLPHTPLVVVSMPLNPSRFAAGSFPRTRQLNLQSRACLVDESGVTVLDATEAVEPRWFSDDTHLTREGHETFARWLLPSLLAVLAPGPS